MHSPDGKLKEDILELDRIHAIRHVARHHAVELLDDGECCFCVELWIQEITQPPQLRLELVKELILAGDVVNRSGELKAAKAGPMFWE